MLTIRERQLDAKDKTILKIVKETPGIRQIELSRRTGFGLSVIRYRIMLLAARGLLEIVVAGSKVTVYPMEARTDDR